MMVPYVQPVQTFGRWVTLAWMAFCTSGRFRYMATCKGESQSVWSPCEETASFPEVQLPAAAAKGAETPRKRDPQQQSVRG